MWSLSKLSCYPNTARNLHERLPRKHLNLPEVRLTLTYHGPDFALSNIRQIWKNIFCFLKKMGMFTPEDAVLLCSVFAYDIKRSSLRCWQFEGSCPYLVEYFIEWYRTNAKISRGPSVCNYCHSCFITMKKCITILRLLNINACLMLEHTKGVHWQNIL